VKPTLLQKIAHASRLAAAALAVLALGRFAFTAVETAIAEEQKPPTAPGPGPTAAGSGSSGRARPSGSPVSSAPSAPRGSPINVQLLVNVGTERSEVFVDGAKVGSSPFVGTVSCRAGDKLDIEVVITKGVVYGYERTCEPGAIRVDAAP
jgi:hypothetical protein